MAKKKFANNKVIMAMGIGIAAMLAMPMYANAEEGEPSANPIIPEESVSTEPATPGESTEESESSKSESHEERIDNYDDFVNNVDNKYVTSHEENVDESIYESTNLGDTNESGDVVIAKGYETDIIEEESHEEKVVDKEAWDEEINHPATYKTITVVDKEAWDETVHHDAITHEEKEEDQVITVVDEEAWDESIRKENDFSDRQSSVCRVIYNGHIHGDISTEQYLEVDIQEAVYEVKIGNLKGELVNNL